MTMFGHKFYCVATGKQKSERARGITIAFVCSGSNNTLALFTVLH